MNYLLAYSALLKLCVRSKPAHTIYIYTLQLGTIPCLAFLLVKALFSPTALPPLSKETI